MNSIVFFRVIVNGIRQERSIFVRRFGYRVFQAEWLTVIIFAVLMMIEILHPPTIGLANNGDYDRLMALVGLHYPPQDTYYYQRYDHYYVPTFVMGFFGHGFYPSSALLPIAVAWVINAAVHFGTFDTQVLFFIYLALLCYGLYWIVRGLRQSFSYVAAISVGAMSVLVLTEVGYAAYLPTLYSEPSSMVFWVLLLGLLFRFMLYPHAWWSRRLVWLCAAFFVTAKVQNAPLVLTVLAGLWGIFYRTYNVYDKRRFVRLASWLVLCAIVVMVLNPPSFIMQNTYDSFFTGLMVVAKPTDHLLRWFHLSGKLAILRNCSYFSAPSLAWQSRLVASGFYHKVSMTRIIWFYLLHPWDIWHGLQISQLAAYVMRPNYLGNFAWIEHKGAGAMAQRFDLWRSIRSTLPKNLWFWVMFSLVFLGTCLAFLRKPLPQVRAVAFLSLMVFLVALLQFPIPFVGEGQNELVKHLFLYDILFDSVLVTAVGFVCHFVWSVVHGRFVAATRQMD